MSVYNKYRNKKTVVDGITFDSKKEANRYLELKLLQRAKAISNLELQPKFVLQEGFNDNKGKRHRQINYVADFRYLENGKTIVEDVKGRETDVFKIKEKLFLNKFRDLEFRKV